MLRAYLVLGALVLSVFGYAQHQGWSLYGSDAQREPGSRGPGGGSGSSYSGHK